MINDVLEIDDFLNILPYTKHEMKEHIDCEVVSTSFTRYGQVSNNNIYGFYIGIILNHVITLTILLQR